eukprot:gene14271-15758_t
MSEEKNTSFPHRCPVATCTDVAAHDAAKTLLAKCYMEDQIRIGSPNGQIVSRLQDFSPCAGACARVRVEELRIRNGGTWRNPSIPCGQAITGSSPKDFFCLNTTDYTIRTSGLFATSAAELQFEYEVDLRRYSDWDTTTCKLIVKIKPALAVTSTSTAIAGASSTSSVSSPTPSIAHSPSSLHSTSSTPSHIARHTFTATPSASPSSWLPRAAVSSQTAPGLPEITLLTSEEVPAVLGERRGKAVFGCRYPFVQYNHLSEFLWIKDGRRIDAFPGNITYSLWTNKTQSMVVQQFLEVSLNKPEAQGYYHCRLNYSTIGTTESIKTLLWFTDVSTTKFFHTANVTNSKGNEKKALFSKIGRQLNASGLNGDQAKLFLSGKQVAGTTSVSLVFVYFLNVNRLDILRICKQLSDTRKPNIHFINLDCCPSKKAKSKSPAGLIQWPITLRSKTATEKCPFAKKNDLNAVAYRTCKADFNSGPVWLAPDKEKCPTKSEMTQKLKDLSDVKMSRTNLMKTLRDLRNVTKKSKMFNDELDIEFATMTLENAMKMDDFLNETADDIVGTTSDLMNSNDLLLSQGQQYSNTSARLLSLISELCDKVNMRGRFECKQENLGLAIETIDEEDIHNGLSISANQNKSTGLFEVQFQRNSNHITAADNLAFIHLSAATLRKINSTQKWKTKRVSGVAYKTGILFADDGETAVNAMNSNLKSGVRVSKLDSKVVSVSVNGHRISGLKGNEELRSYFKLNSSQAISNARRKCVYWNLKARGGLGKWSSGGCTTKGLQDGMFRCSCNHMTNFAILLDITATQPLHESETATLSVISYIGCAVSSISLVITIVTYLFFRKLRKTLPSRILICLSLSLLATMLIFLGGSLVRSTIGCETIAVLLHYFVLASFCWMNVEALNIYRCFVLVFKQASSKFLLKASIFAWGVPLVIVALTSAISRLRNYAKQSGEGWICIITGLPFYVAYLLPIASVLLINFIVLVKTMAELNKQSAMASSQRMTGKSKARISAAFSVLLGCTWIFGLIAVMDVKFAFQVLFCAFNSLQGFFIFVFFCWRSEDAREAWKETFVRLGKGKKARENPSGKHAILVQDFLSYSRSTSKTALTKELSTTM